MHAADGGAPKGNRNALKHGEYAAEAEFFSSSRKSLFEFYFEFTTPVAEGVLDPVWRD
jgi:uncharacterized protein YjcR